MKAAAILLLGCLGAAGGALAADEDPLAPLVTPAARPTPRGRAPATVYVITSEDIRASGARTLWDLLRAVPGVDVVQTRSSHAEVSIRGLAQPLANRTLVLLDGKPVLNGYFDHVFWEEIPVTLEEIERIEIVEGPVSALYGANAINGVINLITKTPAKLAGGVVAAHGGELSAAGASAVYGEERGRVSYKVGLGWRRVNRFEDPDRTGSEAGKAHGQVTWRPEAGHEVALAGGVSRIRTQITTGNNGTVMATGPVGFLRLEGRRGDSHARLFWNRGRQVAREFVFLQEPDFDYDTLDASADRGFALPGGHLATVGAAYRVNRARSQVFRPAAVRQDLAAVFGEDEWRAGRRWTLVAGGRLDHHPFTGWVGSPRGSLIWTPAEGHSVRASAGSAFRNPTLMQNYLEFTQRFPNPDPASPFTAIENRLRGNRDLAPERIVQVEIAHAGGAGPARTTLAGFAYRLRHIITTSSSWIVSAVPPLLRTENTYEGGQDVTAWGGEAGIELDVAREATVFANYSHERLADPRGLRNREAPRHKANAGGRWRGARVTAGAWLHWVDRTAWNATQPSADRRYETLRGYTLLNVGVRYEFAGALSGWSADLAWFNALGVRHHEILPARDAATPGQNGEELGSRWTAGLAYRF